MRKFNRRQFLRSTVLTSASLGILPTLRAQNDSKPIQPAPNAKVEGANGDLRYAVVGFNGRGKDHINELGQLKGARLVALCDVDKTVLEREAKKCEQAGNKLDTYTDIRKLLENKDIDFVTFATPNHWHALGAIWSIQAGKDVYQEKTMAFNPAHARRMKKAFEGSGRIVQIGMQMNSGPGIAKVRGLATAERMGTITAIEAHHYRNAP